MAKSQNKSGRSKLGGLIFLALFGLGLLMLALMHGNDIALLNPKGLIAQQQAHLMLFVTLTLLAIAIPSLLLFYFFAWKYRESNNKSSYDATVHPGKFFMVGLWAIPSLVVLVLTSHMWPATHELDPHKTIIAKTAPLTVQVIALRWKWLFIYPQQDVATVNFLQVPTDTPVQFELTADEAPMNSFWIPQWGGQLYAMTGHDNRLNLMADTPGDYKGGAAEINGVGFAGMKFVARASSPENFDRWLNGLKQTPDVLDSGAYKKLLAPSLNNPAAVYSSVETGLYDSVLAKYMGSNDHHMDY